MYTSVEADLKRENLCREARRRETRRMGYDYDFEAELDATLSAEPDEEEAEIDLILSDGEDRKSTQGRIEVSPSEFTTAAIKIPVAGRIEPFSFEGRPYLPSVYDTSSRRVLIKSSRQCEKSTYLGNLSLAYTTLNVAFKVLYVTATGQQATVFSVDRVRDPIEISPLLTAMTTTKLAQNVLFKQFKNRSQIRIRYAFLSADRTRGISSDLTVIDEFQDILAHNIPVIEQCSSHSMWKLFRNTGTPKSYDNSIQVYWDQFSTQNEWAVPCHRHSPIHWNILGEKNIGKKGPVCSRCKELISPVDPAAHWVSMQPVDESNAERVTFEGYRITQLMVPWIVKNEDTWKDSILFDYNRYDRPKFYNEVLGLSYDSGTRPLTRAQIMACCDDTIDMSEYETNASKCDGVYVGLDWGTGEGSSYTLLTLGGYLSGVFTIFFAHRFMAHEVEPPVQLDLIGKLLSSIGFTLAGCDYGVGFDRNDWLARAFGPEKIKKFQYVGRQKQKVKWESKLSRFTVYRTEIMSDVFNAIKRGSKVIRFPKWSQWKNIFAEDMLNVFSEYSENMRMLQYKVSPGKSDDTMHSIVYCLLASMIMRPRPDILIPVRFGTESSVLY
jgi:hypothetical protein